jgi:hypothetical protein
MKVLRRRPSPAMILAIVALVFAMAGSAVAGSKFVTSKKFKKLKTQVTQLSSQTVQGLTYVNNTVSLPDNTDYTVLSVDCPAGLHPLGGGVKIDHADNSLWWGDGYLTPTGYASAVHNGTGSNKTVVLTVSCAAGNATGAPST